MPADAAVVARLLHDFNTEFSTPTPGAGELQSRLTLLQDTEGGALYGGNATSHDGSA